MNGVAFFDNLVKNLVAAGYEKVFDFSKTFDDPFDYGHKIAAQHFSKNDGQHFVRITFESIHNIYHDSVTVHISNSRKGPIVLLYKGEY